MPLDTDTINRLTLEADLGVPASESKVPPSPEADAFRAKVTAEIAAIKARGHSVKHYDDSAPEPEHVTRAAETANRLGLPRG